MNEAKRIWDDNCEAGITVTEPKDGFIDIGCREWLWVGDSDDAQLVATDKRLSHEQARAMCYAIMERIGHKGSPF